MDHQDSVAQPVIEHEEISVYSQFIWLDTSSVQMSILLQMSILHMK